MKPFYTFTISFVCIILQPCVDGSSWRWRDKIAVVTGASKGIGAKIALSLAESGVVVVALARNGKLLSELAGNSTGIIIPLKCDIRDEKQVLDSFNWIEENLGGVDVLINNAGVYKKSSLIAAPLDDWRESIDTIIVGNSLCSREALKTMRRRGDDGHIIFINSISGHSVILRSMDTGMYSPSKFALTSIIRTLRLELISLGSRIKITDISPDSVVKRKDVPLNGIYDFNIISAQDVVEAVIYALGTRPNVQVQEIRLGPLWAY